MDYLDSPPFLFLRQQQLLLLIIYPENMRAGSAKSLFFMSAVCYIPEQKQGFCPFCRNYQVIYRIDFQKYKNNGNRNTAEKN